MMPLDELPTMASTWPSRLQYVTASRLTKMWVSRPHCGQRARALDERAASRIGVGIDEDELAGGLRECGEERVSFGVGVVEDRDGVPCCEQCRACRRRCKALFDRSAVKQG